MFTKKWLLVGAAFVLALLCSGLIAASAHTHPLPVSKQKTPPYTLVRHIQLSPVDVSFPNNDNFPVLGQVLPKLNNLPALKALGSDGLFGKTLQHASSLLNNLFNGETTSPNGP